MPSTENENLSTKDVVKTPKSLVIEPKPEDIPSFGDFLEFILSTDLLGVGFSSHWVPYWRACTPCHFQYDVIAKLETGEDDLAYIWRKSGIASEVPIPWENKSEVGEKKRELKDFFSSVPRSLLLRVFCNQQSLQMIFFQVFERRHRQLMHYQLHQKVIPIRWFYHQTNQVIVRVYPSFSMIFSLIKSSI